MIAQTAGITLVQRLVPLVVAVAVVVFVVELIRRRKLREEYAMLWICASAVLLVFAAVPHLLWWISGALNINYHTLMLLFGFCFLSLVIVHLSVAVSRTSDDLRKLAQRMALLEQELHDRPEQSHGEHSPRGESAEAGRAAQSPGEST